jgi:hypothetical protein
MANKSLVLGILAIALLLEITVLGCGGDGSPNSDVNWRNFSMTEAHIISQNGIDLQGYFPDGKISIIKDETTKKYIAFWAEFISYRTEADTPYLEDHISQITQDNRVFGAGFDAQDGFNDGGSWFIGVHRLPDSRLVGFFHAESHWTEGMAYKSIGVSYSSDNGHTWTKGEKILNVDYLKPATPKWSGLGDGCVVYNEKRGQFICYYSASAGGDYRICMAVSSAPTGASGTWKKWDGRDFTADGYNHTSGIGGSDTQIIGLQSHPGANPSVLWNSYLQKWVMVYHGWDRVIYMSSSNDGLVWENPVALTNINKETAWYPNLIGNNGDTNGNEILRLYYARNQDSSTGIRELAMRTLTYK